MKCQMIRVISSPSSSTTGLATLIFAMILDPMRLRTEASGDPEPSCGPYSVARGAAKDLEGA
jgi:hypothetical protein